MAINSSYRVELGILTCLLMALVTTACTSSPRAMPLAQAATGETTSEDPVAQQLLAHMGSPGLSVAVQGDFAYLGSTAEFAVVDMTESGHPRSIWQEVVSANDIVILEDAALVGGREGIYLYDLSTRAAPRRLRFLPTPSAVLDLELVGRQLYAALARHGVLHVELLGATELIEHGFVAGEVNAQSLAAYDTYLLVAGEHTITLMDLASPQEPEQLSALSVYGRKEEVVIKYPLAFIVGEGGLWTVAMDDPTELTLTGVALRGAFVHGVSVSESCVAGEDMKAGCVYLAAGVRGLCLAPIIGRSVGADLGCKTWAGSAWDVAVADAMLYVADGDGGLVILAEPTNATLPHYVGSLQSPGAVWRLAANANSLFVQSGWNNRVQSVQTNEQLIAQHAAPIKTAGVAASLAADRQRLCFVSQRGLTVYEIGGSLDTGPTGFLPVDNGIDFVLDGNIGHLLTSDGAYLRIDLRVSQAPLILAETSLAERASDLFVVGESVYVAVGSDGVALVRTDDQSRQTVQFIPVEGNAARLAASETDLFVGTERGTIHGFSVVDGIPFATGWQYELRSSLQEMVIMGDLLVAADTGNRVHFFDISAPAAMPIKTIRLPFPALDVATRQDVLYIADGLGGLFWLETDGLQMSRE